jgi:phosphatidylethanolamine/phosphatidyl-N-methylethanolamine N-methyltransferase
MSLSDGLEFLKQGFRQRNSVGAVWPSSKSLARAMAAPILSDPRHPLRILEVGAGIGPVTEQLTEGLLPEDTLDIVELSGDFCSILRNRFSHMPVRPTVHQVSILDYSAPLPYHHIVSGLPLANFSSDMVEAIYRKFFELLAPGGSFVMFEHILFREALSAMSVGETRKRIKRVIEFEKQLHTLQVGEKHVVFNVPPARVRVRLRPASLAG